MQACELYTQAIQASPSAVLYANRALARTKMEVGISCWYPKQLECIIYI